jgi:hypothetical protein
MRRLGLFALVLISLSCTAIQRQKTLPPRPDDLEFHNLQILPLNISSDELIATMENFERSLGVRCDHCHVRIADTGDRRNDHDFRSDVKPEKSAARVMLRMTEDINRNYVAKIPEVYTTVSCWTCHRGSTQPDIKPSAAAPEN